MSANRRLTLLGLQKFCRPASRRALLPALRELDLSGCIMLTSLPECVCRRHHSHAFGPCHTDQYTDQYTDSQTTGIPQGSLLQPLLFDVGAV